MVGNTMARPAHMAMTERNGAAPASLTVQADELLRTLVNLQDCLRGIDSVTFGPQPETGCVPKESFPSGLGGTINNAASLAEIILNHAVSLRDRISPPTS